MATVVGVAALLFMAGYAMGHNNTPRLPQGMLIDAYRPETQKIFQTTHEGGVATLTVSKSNIERITIKIVDEFDDGSPYGVNVYNCKAYRAKTKSGVEEVGVLCRLRQSENPWKHRLWREFFRIFPPL